MTTHREPPRAATLAAVLARALPDAHPGAIAHAVGAMIHAAKAHKRWGAQTCNYPMTEAQTKRGDRRCERLGQAAYDRVLLCGEGIAPWTGAWGALHMASKRTLRLDFGGDPRGPCGQLIVSDMPGDGFGPGWAIHD